MSDPAHAQLSLGPALVFLGAAIVAAPLFRFLGLGAVVGYLAAGIAIGPSGLRLVADPAATLAVSELGVVLLLFLVGLELQPSRVFVMRRAIVGLGFGQMAAAALAITLGMRWLGLAWPAAFLAGVALAFSATSIALQLMEERGELQSRWGQRAFAILLFQDVSVVPVLALVPLLAAGGASAPVDMAARMTGFALSAGAVVALVVAGRYLLDPAFHLLARAKAREVMTAAALFVALGAAVAMQWAGLSMALGAFLAGLLLSESRFRHELEADIEPFRGLLMGLFFLSVGMSIDARLVLSQAASLFGVALAVILAKLALTTLLMRAARSTWRESLSAAAVLTPAGEFAFVIFPLMAAERLVDRQTADLLLATAALTMLAGPLVALAVERGLARAAAGVTPGEHPDLAPDGAQGAVLVIGFGRFGQIANQVLLAAGADVTVIDANVERIRAAVRFGFKVYYGDGGRLDVLRAAGAETARVITVCIDDRAAATRIVGMARANFPLAKIYARAFDRVHAIDLVNAGVEWQIRETLESALAMGGAAVAELDGAPERARELVEHVRKRDEARFLAQLEEGAIRAGGDYVYREPVRPEPLSQPARAARGLDEQSQAIVAGATTGAAPDDEPAL